MLKEIFLVRMVIAEILVSIDDVNLFLINELRNLIKETRVAGICSFKVNCLFKVDSEKKTEQYVKSVES